MQNANLVKCNPSYNSSSSFKSTNITGLFYVQFTLMSTERTRLIKIISLRLTGLQRKGKNMYNRFLLLLTANENHGQQYFRVHFKYQQLVNIKIVLVLPFWLYRLPIDNLRSYRKMYHSSTDISMTETSRTKLIKISLGL